MRMKKSNSEWPCGIGSLCMQQVKASHFHDMAGNGHGMGMGGDAEHGAPMSTA